MQMWLWNWVTGEARTLLKWILEKLCSVSDRILVEIHTVDSEKAFGIKHIEME